MIENSIPHIASYSENIVQFLWLPCIIWTVLATSGRAVLQVLPDLHPQFHYHGRFAMILALPAGLTAVYTLQAIENMLFAGTAENSLALITFISPVEISTVTITTNPVQSVLWTEWIYAFFLLICISGMFFFTVRYLLQLLILNRLRRSLPLFEIDRLPNLDKVNSNMAAKYKHRILVGFTNKEPAPVAFGWFTPVILLPYSLKKDDKKRNLAIRHELTHITQNDFLSHCGVIITQILFWFHPLIHLLKKELIFYREIRCDSLVLSSKDISPGKYASLLLELLPLPDTGKKLSINMALESSNLKKRIQMIAQQNLNKPIPKRSGLTLFGTIILCTAIAMACTDMQTPQVFDNEEHNLMTHSDSEWVQDYHQIRIFLSEKEQAKKQMRALTRLQETQPDHIISVNTLYGDAAIKKYDDRGSAGVIEIYTNIGEESYTALLETLEMPTADLSRQAPGDKEEMVFVVEQVPELIGGLEQIQRNLRYPETARRAGIEGRVYVQFVVDEQGGVQDPRVSRGIGGGADEEALRVVSNARFTPAMQDGKPVKVHYSLPVFFRLDSAPIDQNYDEG
jgi:TonB family protein